MSELGAFFGHFHPLLVHLPIGGLAVAALLALASRRDRGAHLRSALPAVLTFSACAAIAAVLAGQSLATTGGWGGSTLTQHQLLGYAVAIVSTLAAGEAWRERRQVALETSPRRLTRSNVLLGGAVLLLTLTGHLGGTLTHGPDYLTAHLPGFLRGWFSSSDVASTSATVRPREVVAYSVLVAPILETHCTACHGPDKASGGLRLDGPDHIRAGGSGGAVLTPGQAMRSELVRRVWLPPSHRDVMPPKGRPALAAADANVLRWWVENGASFEASLADVEVTDDVRPAIEARVGTLPRSGPAVLALDAPPANDTAFDEAVRQGLPVSRLSDTTSFVQVQARGTGRAFGDAQVQALAPLAPQITWLDLGGTGVTDAALATIATFPNLTRLHLDRTAITDAGLARLGELAHLEYLNLYGTAVTDAGLEPLSKLPQLQALYVWQTQVTPAGIATITAARPKLTVHRGIEPAEASAQAGLPRPAKELTAAPKRDSP